METITKFTPKQYEIVKEIINSLDKLGGDSGLIAPIASWGDTLSDDDVLQQLVEYNAKYLLQHL